MESLKYTQVNKDHSQIFKFQKSVSISQRLYMYVKGDGSMKPESSYIADVSFSSKGVSFSLFGCFVLYSSFCSDSFSFDSIFT